MDVKKVDKWVAPTENGAPLLCMPNIPKPLHNCLRGDAEVLTSIGWKRIDQVGLNDIVATWGIDTEKIIWDKPYEVIKSYQKQMVRIKFEKYKTFGMLTTADHRFPIRKKTDGRVQVNGVRKKSKQEWVLKDTTAATINLKQFQHFITAARNGTELNSTLSDEERVYIALQADGTIRHETMESIQHNRRYEDTKGLYSYRISLKKDRKKERLEDLLSKAKIKFTKQNHSDDSTAHQIGYQKYDIWVNRDCKNFWNCFDITDFSQEKARQFIDEISLWDGSCQETCGILNQRYTTTVEGNAKFAQAVAVLAGKTSSLQINDRSIENPKWKKTYIIDFLDRDYRATQSCVKEVEPFDDYAYCINVPTSYFVARDGDTGSVMITGNCAPRLIDGQAKWNIMRTKCYMDADYTCQACGTYLGAGKCEAHELYSIDWQNQRSKFERTVCLCKFCHQTIHSGRSFTLYQKGERPFDSGYMLKLAKKAFENVAQWNTDNIDGPLRLYGTFIDWAKDPELGKWLEPMINKYEIEFYAPRKAHEDKKSWGKWRLLYNGKEYEPKYKDAKEWMEAMNE